MALIAKKLNKSSGYVSQYRLRMLKEGIIKSEGRGLVEFVLPQFREYLRGIE
jgi:hypothetical protein